MEKIIVGTNAKEDLKALKAALIKKGVITENEIKAEKDK
jgi:hypothetical protein